MNQEPRLFPEDACSCLQLEVVVQESWIDRLLIHHQVIIPVGDRYHLIRLRVNLDDGKISMDADIREKKNSSVRIVCLPKWDNELQHLLLDELEINLISKNLMLKSAGWFAKTFMGAKIDKKIQAQVNQLYAHQVDTILKDGIHLPLPNAGKGMARIRSFRIEEMIFEDHAIRVKAQIDGYWHLHLT